MKNLRPEALELAEIATILQRRFLMNLSRQVVATKISIPQFSLLSYLYVEGTLNMGALAKLMGHTTPATTGLVDRLIQAGLVERFAVPNDRRQVRIGLTPEGKKIVQRMKDDMAQRISELLEKLSPEDREAWVRIYRLLLEHCYKDSEIKNPHSSSS